MIDFNAHFDGKVIVPEQAVDLPLDCSFTVHVETFGGANPVAEISPQSALQWSAEMLLTTTCRATSPHSTITISTVLASRINPAS
jgi:hypothetical protein